MPRQRQMDYPSAVHHVISRGDRRGDILEGDVDRQTFMVTLAEAGQKAGWQHDSMNRLTHLVWRNGNVLVGGYSYSINAQGLRVQSGETNNGIARNFSWYYDSLRRMVGETVSGGTPGSLSYVLDSVGNRTSRSGSLGGLGVQSFRYDRNDWMDNDTDPSNANADYDAQGNPVQYQGTHQYDWADRLTNFNSGAVSLVYDAEGNRVKKVANGVTTLYLVAAVNLTGYPQVVEELTVSGGVTNLARVYDYGLGLWCQRSPGGTTRFYGTDGHGSVRFLTDGVGAVTDTYAYDAYGNVLSTTGSTVNPYRYTGQQWDSDLGMYYLRARYYKPELGRFWTMDTYEGSRGDPLSLHKYLYCAGNPVCRTDPSGHDFNIISFSVSAAIRGGIAGATFGSISAGFSYAKGATLRASLTRGLQVAALTEFAFVSPLAAVSLGLGGVATTGLGIYNGDITSDNIPEIGAYVLAGLVLHATLSPAQAAASESAAFSVATPIRIGAGTKVFRIYIPGRSKWDGTYWTTLDPRNVRNYPDAAGLPVDIARAIQNGEARLVVGEMINAEEVPAASAVNSAATDAASKSAALEGIANRGGLLEVRIFDAAQKVKTVEDVPFQQYWGFK